jgi:homoserine kinase
MTKRKSNPALMRLKPRLKPLRLKPLHLKLPATSANLGPAFDAAALALDIYITIDAKAAGEFSITAGGRDREICQNLENHLILTTYGEILQAAGRDVLPLSLKIENDIPIGKGCGSSAAARLAGIALANHFGKLCWTDMQIISEAARREHHADNASACWLGGLAIAGMSDDGTARVAQIHPKGDWPLLLAVPDHALSTEKARAVLPAQYSRGDAVANIQNSMLLLAAFAQRRPELLAFALEDRIHQPYRSELCPLLPCLSKLSGTKGLLGVALSGAGPSVIIFLDAKTPAAKTRKLVESHLAKSALRAELIPARISSRVRRA